MRVGVANEKLRTELKRPSVTFVRTPLFVHRAQWLDHLGLHWDNNDLCLPSLTNDNARAFKSSNSISSLRSDLGVGPNLYPSGMSMSQCLKAHVQQNIEVGNVARWDRSVICLWFSPSLPLRIRTWCLLGSPTLNI
jgi:hypothetical protein